MTADTVAPARKLGRHDVGLVFAVAFAVVLVWVIEWMAIGLVRGGGNGQDWLVLGLFGVPTLIALLAIAKSMARWPGGARTTSSLMILLVPPALLFVSGAFHG